MNKTKPNIKESIPYLSGKERAKLFFENTFSQTEFLTKEEERLLAKIDTQKQSDEWWEYFCLVMRRMALTILFLNAVSEFRSKAASLGGLYMQIFYEMPLRTVARFLDAEGNDTKDNVKIAKALLQDFLKRVGVLDSETDNERRVERTSFAGDARATLKDTAATIFQDIEQLINMREALRRIDEELGKPRYPRAMSGERLNECMGEVKSAQKLHNRAIFALLKTKLPNLPIGFKREIEDLNAYIIKTPKIRCDLVKKYMDFMQKRMVESK